MTESPRPDPSRILQHSFGFAPGRVLQAAVDLEVFTHLAAGADTVAEVARRTDSSERGLRFLLDALAGLGFVTKPSADRYVAAPDAAFFLDRAKESYLGHALHLDLLWPGWGRLTEAVRTGAPVREKGEGLMGASPEETSAQFFVELVPGLFQTNYPAARRLGEFFRESLGETRPVAILDIGAGSGVWGIACAEAMPRAKVTAADFAAVNRVGRKFAEDRGLTDRYTFLDGDFRTADFGEGAFDVVILGHIVHGEGEERTRVLFRRIARALRPGGWIAIADMIPDEDRTGPAFPLLFALNMLVHTEAGGTYTLREYDAWLGAAGFEAPRTLDVPSVNTPMVLARKTSPLPRNLRAACDDSHAGTGTGTGTGTK